MSMFVPMFILAALLQEPSAGQRYAEWQASSARPSPLSARLKFDIDFRAHDLAAGDSDLPDWLLAGRFLLELSIAIRDPSHARSDIVLSSSYEDVEADPFRSLGSLRFGQAVGDFGLKLWFTIPAGPDREERRLGLHVSPEELEETRQHLPLLSSGGVRDAMAVHASLRRLLEALHPSELIRFDAGTRLESFQVEGGAAYAVATADLESSYWQTIFAELETEADRDPFADALRHLLTSLRSEARWDAASGVALEFESCFDLPLLLLGLPETGALAVVVKMQTVEHSLATIVETALLPPEDETEWYRLAQSGRLWDALGGLIPLGSPPQPTPRLDVTLPPPPPPDYSYVKQ